MTRRQRELLAAIEAGALCELHYVSHDPSEPCPACEVGHDLGYDLADHPVHCEICRDLTAHDEEHAPLRGWVVCPACVAVYDRELSEWLQRRAS